MDTKLTVNGRVDVQELTVVATPVNNTDGVNKQYVDQQINAIVFNILDAYPVGSIYQTTNNSFNPNTAWGGVWNKIEGVFLLGSNTAHPIGQTGGSETVTLTTSQIPSHSHSIGTAQRITGYFQAFRGNAGQVAGGAFTSTHVATGGIQGGGYQETDRFDFDSSRSTGSGNTGSQGSGQSHNNMPPYKSVNIWERVQ